MGMRLPPSVRHLVLFTAALIVGCVAALGLPSAGKADPTFDFGANHDGVMALVLANALGTQGTLTADEYAELEGLQTSSAADSSGSAAAVESGLGEAGQTDAAVPTVGDMIESAESGLSGDAALEAEITEAGGVEAGLAGGALVAGFAIGSGLNTELHLSCSIDGFLGSGSCAAETADTTYSVWVQPMGHFLHDNPAIWGGPDDACGCTPGYGTKDYDGTRHWHAGLFYDAVYGPTSGTTSNPYAGSIRPGTVLMPHTGDETAGPLPTGTDFPDMIGAFGKLQTLKHGSWQFWEESNYDTSDWCTADTVHGTTWDGVGCADWVTPAADFQMQQTEPPRTVNDATLSADGGIPVPAPTPLSCDVASSCYTNITTTLSGNPLTKAWVEHILQPADFPANPVTGEWAMPDCTGLSVADCESAITNAAADDDISAPSFTVVTATTGDPDIANDLVIGQDPAASLDGLPEAVTITKNPTDGGEPPGCSSTTQNPHWSFGTGGVIAKGTVVCDYAGTALVTMGLWKCSDPPSADAAALALGEWGCVSAATTSKTLAVYPGDPETIYVPDIGAPSVSGDAYFIAETTVDGTTSWSQDEWYVNDES